MTARNPLSAAALALALGAACSEFQSPDVTSPAARDAQLASEARRAREASAEEAPEEPASTRAKGAHVQIGKAEPSPDCTLLGVVTDGSISADTAYEELRARAAEKGGNFVVLDAIRRGMWGQQEFVGRAYSCPSPSSAPARAERPKPKQETKQEAAACEPDCSPGYVCLRGKCVSACNPPCENGERCGADRWCHPKE